MSCRITQPGVIAGKQALKGGYRRFCAHLAWGCSGHQRRGGTQFSEKSWRRNPVNRYTANCPLRGELPGPFFGRVRAEILARRRRWARERMDR